MSDSGIDYCLSGLLLITHTSQLLDHRRQMHGSSVRNELQHCCHAKHSFIVRRICLVMQQGFITALILALNFCANVMFVVASN